MPRKPQFIHPVRQVRTCLGYSQPAFAKLVGCSAIAIQRIENGSLTLSAKLANVIMDATGADPKSLRVGNKAEALDMLGHGYSKKSLEVYKKVVPSTEKELQFLLFKLMQNLELLLTAANQGKFKAYALNSAVQNAFLKLAADFNLESGIRDFLIKNGGAVKRKYRVSDLRKFPDYARILGFKDSKRFKPDKAIEFTITRGWIRKYYLHESPALPHGADRKLRDADYYFDDERAIPEEVKEAISEALYWKIEDFRLDLSQ